MRSQIHHFYWRARRWGIHWAKQILDQMTRSGKNLWCLATIWSATVSVHLARFANTLRKHTNGILRWLRTLGIFLLWLSLEVPIRAWELFQRVRPMPAGSTNASQRAFFCMAFSLTVIQIAVLLLVGMHLSFWLCVLCALHGLVVHLVWDKGTRWCKRQMGLRPVHSFDPKNPYAGLDLGN